jgi:aspartate 1-decarboxylase
MQRILCKSKIHRATVTEANVDYVGSITLDADLMKAADILPYEQVQVLNLTNGSRLTTYAIEGKAGSGMVCMNGAAALLTVPGDLIIVLAFGLVEDHELGGFKPSLVFVDRKNRQVRGPRTEEPGKSFKPRRVKG